MKRYVNQFAYDKMLKFLIYLDVTVNANIAASYNPDYSEALLNEDIGDMALQQYNNFIQLLTNRLKREGFELLEPTEESNNDGSLSRYFVMCRKSDYDTLTVEFIVYLRISDHRLSKRKGTNRDYDRHEARNNFQVDEIQHTYSELNAKHPDIIDNVDVSVVVSGNKFKTYREALHHIINVLRPYM